MTEVIIEVGGTYELNNGESQKCIRMEGNDPLAVDKYGYGPFVLDGMLYHQDGRFGDNGADHALSVKRRIDIPETDTPKTWGEMTDAEREAIPQHYRDDPANPLGLPFEEMSDVGKGAMLLAYHEGKDIQCLQDCETPEYWGDIDRPNWSNDCKFRVRPEPVRDVVELFGGTSDVWGQDRLIHDTHRITFETADGKPDCDTINMEVLL
tara:strand:+ start:1416 stop:2039 length:624 start_codon:yes stop_codon:yes gene_type:complete